MLFKRLFNDRTVLKCRGYLIPVVTEYWKVASVAKEQKFNFKILWLPSKRNKTHISSFKGAAGKHQLVMEFDFGTVAIWGKF